MEKRGYGERLKDLAVRVIELRNALPKTATGYHIGMPVRRFGTSAGADYCEARGAESRADFAHKMQVVVKELRETQYWVEIIGRAKLIDAAQVKTP